MAKISVAAFESRVQILKAVAHPVRLALVAALARRPCQVNALAATLAVPQSIVSQQLRILRMARLVAVQRNGGRAAYVLTEPHLKDLLKCMDRCCASRR